MRFIIIFLLSIIRELEANQIGTTLFTKVDLYKGCWSNENLALLSSRIILEDILPPATLTVDSKESIEDLIEYFRLIIEVVRRETIGRTKHLILTAMTDLLGGYLHYSAIPVSKYSYYAGLINYEAVKSLLLLFSEFKWFLRTDGQGWAGPVIQFPDNYNIERIPQTELHATADPCDKLIFTEVRGKDEEIEKFSIPLPYFDLEAHAQAIALPIRGAPLHNLESSESTYVLTNFFISAYQCLIYKNIDPEEYEMNFNDWMEKRVIPMLNDEDKFYPAFGGILRVRETLTVLRNSRLNFDETAMANQTIVAGQSKYNTRHMVLTAALIVIIVWIILTLMFLCFKCKKKKNGKCCDDVCSSTKTNCLPLKRNTKTGKSASTPDSSPTSDDSCLDFLARFDSFERSLINEAKLNPCKCGSMNKSAILHATQSSKETTPSDNSDRLKKYPTNRKVDWIKSTPPKKDKKDKKKRTKWVTLRDCTCPSKETPTGTGKEASPPTNTPDNSNVFGYDMNTTSGSSSTADETEATGFK